MPKNNHWVHKYYIQHSEITDPRDYAHLFDGLPHDIPGLVKTVQGLLFHLLWEKSYHYRVPVERRKEIYLRSIPKMMERILALDPAPLSVARPPEKRLVSICRDYGVMLVAMLRHQGIPARLRIGFAGYFRGERPRFWDHRITEYWNEALSRWVLVDPQIDDIQRAAIGLAIDTLNISDASPFLPAGKVWQSCRAGIANPDDFGDSPEDIGMPPIRYALLHDFDALNKVELVGFDTWHALINKPENEVTEDERKFLDEVAEITTNADTRFADLQTLYRTSAYGQAVRNQLSSLQ